MSAAAPRYRPFAAAAPAVVAWLGLLLGFAASSPAGESPRISWLTPAALMLGEQSAEPSPPAPLFPPPAPNNNAATEEEAPAANDLEDVLRRLEALEQADRPEEKRAAERESADDWLDLSGEKWNVRLGGHIQMDYVLWPDADPAITDPDARNYFAFRRLRLMADGTGYGVYDFRLQMEFRDPDTQVKDAYLTVNELPWLNRVRLGHFFVPFGLEQVTNDTFNVFLERSIPTQGIFTADREVGLATYNVNYAQDVTWTFGVFFHEINETTKQRIDSNQGTRLSGRVTWLPYYDELSGGRYLVHTGAGILHTDPHDDAPRFRARPHINLGPRLIDSGALPANNHTIGNVELAAVWGPLAVQSEAYLTNVNLIADGNVLLHGAYLYFTYFLTGEHRNYERFGQHGAQFGRPVPHSNFFWVPGGCGPGAWELKSRVSYLSMSDIDRGTYYDFTAGFNWYWSDRVRIMFDWIHPITTADAVFGQTQSDILGMRFDVQF